jgi:hypothetical protein
MKPLNEEQLDDHSKSFSRISGSNSQLNDFYKSFTSTSSSSESIRNINSLEYFPIKLTYILITILNTSLGLISLLKHYQIFIRQEVPHILIYIILFTFHWPIVIFLGFIISGLIVMIKKVILFFKNKNQLVEEDEINISRLEENSNNDVINTTILSNHFYNHSYFSFLVGVIIIILICLYTICIPFSFFSTRSLLQNKLFYQHYQSYVDTYLFILLNFVKSLVIFCVAFYYLFKKKFKSNKLKIELDEEFIKQVEKEVEQANKFSGVIAPAQDLIKFNSMFNRQYASDLKEEAGNSGISNHQVNLPVFNDSSSLDFNLKKNNFNGKFEKPNLNSNFFHNTTTSKTELMASNTDKGKINYSNTSEMNLNSYKKERNLNNLNNINYYAENSSQILPESKEDKKTRIKYLIKNKTIGSERDIPDNYSQSQSIIQNFKIQLNRYKTDGDNKTSLTVSKSPMLSRKKPKFFENIENNFDEFNIDEEENDFDEEKFYNEKPKYSKDKKKHSPKMDEVNNDVTSEKILNNENPQLHTQVNRSKSKSGATPSPINRSKDDINIIYNNYSFYRHNKKFEINSDQKNTEHDEEKERENGASINFVPEKPYEQFYPKVHSTMNYKSEPFNFSNIKIEINEAKRKSHIVPNLDRKEI